MLHVRQEACRHHDPIVRPIVALGHDKPRLPYGHDKCITGVLEHGNRQGVLVMVSSRVSFSAEVMRTGIGKLPCQSPFSCSQADPF